MRLFIALPLPPDVRRTLTRAQSLLRSATQEGRDVPEDNFHITLHFIGESDDIAGAAAACDGAVRGIRPFLLRLNGFSSFARGNSHTVFMNVTGDLTELYALHESLISALHDYGFHAPRKRLKPHITLARDVALSSPAELASLTPEVDGGSAFTSNQLVLYESRRENNRMRYIALHKSGF